MPGQLWNKLRACSTIKICLLQLNISLEDLTIAFQYVNHNGVQIAMLLDQLNEILRGDFRDRERPLMTSADLVPQGPCSFLHILFIFELLFHVQIKLS